MLYRFFHSAAFLPYVRVDQSLFNMGERAEFIHKTQNKICVFFPPLLLKWMTWLDIFRKIYRYINFDLTKILFPMTV